jgi:outer membrane protein OmpA-like peptidoglycan-associated protein
MRRIVVALLLATLIAGCATTTTSPTGSEDPNRKTKKGAVAGAVAGAIAGAIIGNQSGESGAGAAIGAIVGAGVGAAVGRRMDQQQQELQQIEGVEVERTDEDELNVVMKSDILFDVDSSALRPDSRATLDDISAVFARYPEQTIRVEGHADSTGTDEYNQALSERRAASVRDYIVERGVASERIEAIGYGELRPRETNDTPDGRQLNRRVEIHVKADEDESTDESWRETPAQ